MTNQEKQYGDRPLISYALTSYNLGKYVRESVEAAFAQTYSPLEIILSDDCSTDSTYEIMREMAAAYRGPHRIVLNRNEQNLGVVRHCNAVYLNLAHGELIVIAHGDDLSLPERTQRSWEYLNDHPECAGLSFSLFPIDETGRPIPQLQRDMQVEVRRSFALNGATVQNGVPNIPSPSRAIRRSVMDAFGPMDPRCPVEDDVIGLRILMSGAAVFLPDVMVYYRKHGSNLSNSNNFDAVPLIKIYTQELRDIKTATKQNIIGPEEASRLRTVLKVNIKRRFLTRAHYQHKNLKTLSAILFSELFSTRFKLGRIKFHFAMMRRPWLYR